MKVYENKCNQSQQQWRIECRPPTLHRPYGGYMVTLRVADPDPIDPDFKKCSYLCPVRHSKDRFLPDPY